MNVEKLQRTNPARLTAIFTFCFRKGQLYDLVYTASQSAAPGSNVISIRCGTFADKNTVGLLTC
jgi:hypothetical protein